MDHLGQPLVIGELLLCLADLGLQRGDGRLQAVGLGGRILRGRGARMSGMSSASNQHPIGIQSASNQNE